MFSFIKRLFTSNHRPIPMRSSPLVLVDGDAASRAHLLAINEKFSNVPINLIKMRAKPPAHEPKYIPARFDTVLLEGRAGKEVVDKFIIGSAARYLSEGGSDLIIATPGDGDMVDIAVMLGQLFPKEEIRIRVFFLKKGPELDMLCSRARARDNRVTVSRMEYDY